MRKNLKGLSNKLVRIVYSKEQVLRGYVVMGGSFWIYCYIDFILC